MLTVTGVQIPEVLASREGDWWSLLARSSTDEPTLSPDWLLTWWHVFGADGDRALNCLFFEDGKRLVGLLPLLRRTTRDFAGPLRRLELMASGEPEADEICSEFIGAVVERGYEEAVAETLAAVLTAPSLGPPWDEVRLEAMNGSSLFPALLARHLGRLGAHHAVEVADGAPYIPLPPREYDFLAGIARYKTELALAVRPLVRLRVWRPSFRGVLRRLGEALWRQLRAARMPASEVEMLPAGRLLPRPRRTQAA